MPQLSLDTSDTISSPSSTIPPIHNTTDNMPESHFSNPFFPNDKSLAMQIVEASRYEQAHVASSKPSRKHNKTSSDTASVSSFGSSVSLLKSKFRASPSGDKTSSSSSQKMLLRNQVNIIG